MNSEEESKSTATEGFSDTNKSPDSYSFTTDLPEFNDSGTSSPFTDSETRKSLVPDKLNEKQNNPSEKKPSVFVDLTINPQNITETEQRGKEQFSSSSPFQSQEASNPSSPDKSTQSQNTSLDQMAADLEELTIDPQSNSNKEKGGEWDRLLAKLSGWWEINQIPVKIDQLIKPGIALLVLVAFLFLLQIYGRFLNGIAQIPLAPRLFELTGIIWLIRFSITRLVRSQDRQELTLVISKRLQTLLGQSEREK